jgi:hypothetical protein
MISQVRLKLALKKYQSHGLSGLSLIISKVIFTNKLILAQLHGLSRLSLIFFQVILGFLLIAFQFHGLSKLEFIIVRPMNYGTLNI